MSAQVRSMGLDPSLEDDLFSLANGPIKGEHHLGLDWHLGPDLQVSSLVNNATSK